MKNKRNYEVLEPIELSYEEAEKELGEARINFRWGREQLNLVKRTANLMGVPYKTYIK